MMSRFRKILFDTGSSDTWVPGIGCANCGLHSAFNDLASSTAVPMGRKFRNRCLTFSMKHCHLRRRHHQHAVACVAEVALLHETGTIFHNTVSCVRTPGRLYCIETGLHKQVQQNTTSIQGCQKRESPGRCSKRNMVETMPTNWNLVPRAAVVSVVHNTRTPRVRFQYHQIRQRFGRRERDKGGGPCRWHGSQGGGDGFGEAPGAAHSRFQG